MARNFFAALLLITIVFPSSGLAQMSCSSLLQAVRSTGSSSRQMISGFIQNVFQGSAAKSKEQRRAQDEKARARTVQLNRLLFPLLIDLKSAAHSITREEVRQRLEQLEAQTPVKAGEFRQRANGSEPEVFKGFGHSRRQAFWVYEIQSLPQAIRLSSFKYIDPDSGRIQRMGEFHNTLSAGLTPVGFYGEKFAADLLRTTQIMTLLVEDHLTQKSVRLYEHNKDFFDGNMHRAMQIAEGQEAGQPELSLNSAMMEGILSFSQLVGVLLNGGIEGIENPKEALRAVVDGGADRRGLTASITQLIPPGLVAPMAHAGFAFGNTLSVDAEGRWIMTPELRDTLKSLRDKHTSERNTAAVGCPFAAVFRRVKGEQDPAVAEPDDLKVPGLQLLAEAFFHIYSIVSERPE